MKKLTIDEFEARLKIKYPNEKLKVISYGGDKKISEVVCKSCKTHYLKNSGCFLDRRIKSICKICHPTQPNTLKERYIPPTGYKLIEPYKGMHTKIKVKHSCGFIWEITSSNLSSGKGCPKCNKKMSKGEQKIEQWLIANQIDYVKQKKISIAGHNLFLDFYLPKYDLYIEYNGEQHYHPVKFFGGESRFQRQVQLDNLKKAYLKNHLIVISYQRFHEIETILKSSTTIPNGSRL